MGLEIYDYSGDSQDITESSEEKEYLGDGVFLETIKGFFENIKDIFEGTNEGIIGNPEKDMETWH